VSHSDGDAAVLLHFMLMMRTSVCCVGWARSFPWRCRKSCTSFMQSFLSYHMSCMLSFCLKWNLFFF